MILKFEVGEIWRSRSGALFVIDRFLDKRDSDVYPVVAKRLVEQDYFYLNKMGKEISELDSPYDLITYIGNKQTHPEYFL